MAQHVSSESKNKEPDKLGLCHPIMGLDSTCTCPTCVILGSRRSWNEEGPVQPDGSGEVIRTESALAPSISTARYQQGNIYSAGQQNMINLVAPKWENFRANG